MSNQNQYARQLSASLAMARFNINEKIVVIERDLRRIQYEGVFGTTLWTQDFRDQWSDLNNGSLALDLEFMRHDNELVIPPGAPHPIRYLPVRWILAAAALRPPHGLEVLIAPPSPVIPTVPELHIINVGDDVPHSMRVLFEQSVREMHEERCGKIKAKIEIVRHSIADKIRKDEPNVARATAIAELCRQGDLDAIRTLMLTILRRHPLPRSLVPVETDFSLDIDLRIARCTFELPDFSKLKIVKKDERSKVLGWSNASEAQRKRASHQILYSLCVRAAYLVAKGDPGHLFDTVAVNARKRWFDPATGHPTKGIVASIKASKEILCQLEPDRLDPTACFSHLGGISVPNLVKPTPIGPLT